MTLYAVMGNSKTPWRGEIWEASSAEEAVRMFEENTGVPTGVAPIVLERVLVKKWVEEEV